MLLLIPPQPRSPVAIAFDICARLYDGIVALRPHWHDDDHRKGDIKLVSMAAASDVDHLQPHHTSKQQKQDLEKRFKTDPLKIVLVRDMWLTGFDAPGTWTSRCGGRTRLRPSPG